MQSLIYTNAMSKVDISILREKLIRLREETERGLKTSDELSEVVELDQDVEGLLGFLGPAQHFLAPQHPKCIVDPPVPHQLALSRVPQGV